MPEPEINPSGCSSLYVYAPGNYIVDMASGSEVVLDPAMQDFQLFCSPAEARRGLEQEISLGRLPAGDWRIYRLDGAFEDIAEIQGGKYVLTRMASLADWEKQ